MSTQWTAAMTLDTGTLGLASQPRRADCLLTPALVVRALGRHPIQTFCDMTTIQAPKLNGQLALNTRQAHRRRLRVPGAGAQRVGGGVK